jgi:hypothetical protein
VETTRRDIIALLDDEPDRIAVMKPWLLENLPSFQVEVFENAPDMIEWLASGVNRCRLICLDHDLGPNQNRNGQVFDPGTGRDVADALAQSAPICPIVIHTTNLHARPGMVFVLEDAGWSVSYVTPYEDTRWIREMWADAIRTVMS